jgi:hypothetical protein
MEKIEETKVRVEKQVEVTPSDEEKLLNIMQNAPGIRE